MNYHLPEVLFEFYRVGQYIRVCAIDPVTKTEVTIVGSPQSTEEHLKQVALSKLKYVLKKKAH